MNFLRDGQAAERKEREIAEMTDIPELRALRDIATDARNDASKDVPYADTIERAASERIAQLSG